MLLLFILYRYMLWTSPYGTITKAGMEAKFPRVIMQSSVGQSVLAMTIEYATDQIYWIRSPDYQVWACDMDGRNRCVDYIVVCACCTMTSVLNYLRCSLLQAF